MPLTDNSSSCNYTELSYVYRFSVSATNQYDSIDDQERSIVQIMIHLKINQKLVYSFEFTTESLVDNLFQDCKNGRSYITGYNLNSELLDNNFGDIVVVDLNFDGLEDLALINESGGINGPSYLYFIQSSDQKILLDTFLSEDMIFFPTEINLKKRTLTTYVIGGVSYFGKYVYKYDVKKQKWKEIHHKVKKIRDE